MYPKMDLGSLVSVSECQIAGKSHPARLKVCYIFVFGGVGIESDNCPEEQVLHLGDTSAALQKTRSCSDWEPGA